MISTTGRLSFTSGYTTSVSTFLPSCLIVTHSLWRGDLSMRSRAHGCDHSCAANVCAPNNVPSNIPSTTIIIPVNRFMVHLSRRIARTMLIVRGGWRQELFGDARCCAGQEKIAFADVTRERCGARELRLRFGEAPQLEEQVSADAGQEVIRLKRRLGDERIDQLKPSGGTEGHGHGHRAIQLYNRRRRDPRKFLVMLDDAPPVRLLRPDRSRVASGNRRLQRIRPARAAHFFGALQRREAAPNQQLIPAAAILFQ